ncbi:MAG: dephospho-CoA kinase [Opitutales bacterium]|nr:dephospho-CoA kinase [Opitutales bacterium]
MSKAEQSTKRLRIGLTGGIGCGKSTALEYFRGFGARTFDADVAVRGLLENDTETQSSVRSAFGERAFNAEGRVDRAALGKIVFGCSQALATLESILHPRVRKAWQALLRSEHALVVVEIPLLFENNLQSEFDFTICLSVCREIQTHRLRGRGLSLSQIDLRRARQWSLGDKVRHADVVFVNEGNRDHLGDQVRELLRRRKIL